MANSSYAEYINRISDYVTHYSIIINLSVGVPLNLVNVLVFTRIMLNKTNKTNMGILGLCQSVVDIILLLYHLLILRSTSFFPISLIRTSDSICKLISFIRRLLTCSSSWMEVVTTFDRFTFVIFGHTGRLNLMKKRCFMALIILGLINLINLFFYLSRGKCTADNSILIASDMIMITTRLYIPFFMMIFSNIYMIRIVTKTSKAALRQTSNARKEHHFTRSVIANDAFFLLFHLPNSIYFILNDINLYSGAFNGDPLFAANYKLFGNIARNFSLFFQTFSFFIYLTFNKLYRREIWNLIEKPIKFLVLKIRHY